MAEIVIFPGQEAQPEPLGEPIATIVLTIRDNGKHTAGITTNNGRMSDVDIYLTASEAMLDAAENAVRTTVKQDDAG